MTTMENIMDIDAIKGRIWDTYVAMSDLPRPESYRVGGTYYGSTQLFSSVGNMLDPINGEPYVSHGYGGSTRFEEVWGIKIGGAYDTSYSKELRDYLYKVKETIFAAGWGIINDHGSNFSVIGIGR